ncbi:MAG: integrase family protein [Betaproteobacteria bacterium]|nr:integrase family protein [Betaproteobacteria bacterium]
MSKLQNRVRLTAGRVDAFTCPAGKSQAFLWDTDTPALALRVTPTGRKTYVFESRLNGDTIRVSIGTATDWPIEKARGEAQRLKVLVDSGTDPRELERQQQADKTAAKAAAAVQAVTVGEAWAAYVAERTPHWGDLHRKDHERLTRAGGETSKRGTRGRGVTIAGPLHPLLALPLRDLTAPVIEAWAAHEAQTRPTAARLAWRLLKAFLGWCAEQPEYAPVLPSVNPAKTKKAREALGKAKAKDDSLLKEQLPAWFAAVRSIGNPTVAAYLQTLLLTGARPGEVLAMRWDDLNTQWRGLTIRDKVEGERVIPLTPYVWHLLAALPRRNEFVFASTRNKDTPLTEPNHAHDKACKVAAIDALTLHGLRRSFGTLSEWLEVPAGVVAQIQGHKPSATAEKHYRVRPLDLLRVHHERIEAWVLEQAGIVFDGKAEPGKLRAVN